MKNVRINISVFFAVLIACILMLDTTGYAVLALFCAAVHESGHFLTLRLMKMPVREISFKTFGVSIRLASRTRLTYGQEVVLALSGCAANLLFFLAAALLWRAGILKPQMLPFAAMNLLLCLFNLLPIGPLDGGRALEAVLCRKLQPNRVNAVLTVLSVLFLIPLVYLGVSLLMLSRYNFTLILAAVYLSAAVLMKGKLIDVA